MAGLSAPTIPQRSNRPYIPVNDNKETPGIAEFAAQERSMATAVTAPFSPARAAPDARASEPRRGLLARLFDALAEGRRRDADLRVAAYLEGTRGRLTDQVEREMQKLL